MEGRSHRTDKHNDGDQAPKMFRLDLNRPRFYNRFDAVVSPILYSSSLYKM